jgi:hypothetical protein
MLYTLAFNALKLAVKWMGHGMEGTGAWIKRQRRFMIQPRVGDEGAYPGFGE